MAEYGGKENLDFLEKVPNYLDAIEALLLEFIGTGKTVLDFGAGSGTYARRLMGRGVKPDCVEIDPEYCSKLSAQGFNAVKTLAELPQNYERIYSCDVIEHIADDMGILKELHAKLADDGKIFIYVPAFSALYSEMDKKIGHFRRYKKNGLVEKMQAAGFKITSVEYVDSIGFFGGLFYKYFGDKNGNIDSPAIYKYYKHIFPLSRLFDKFGARYLLGKNLLVIARK